MKKIVMWISVVLIFLASACNPGEEIFNAPDPTLLPTQSQLVATSPKSISETITPTNKPTEPLNLPTSTATPACSRFFESGITLPTSTPTLIEYRDPSDKLVWSITRQIAYADFMSQCFDQPNTDIFINIWRNDKKYELSATEILNSSPRLEENIPVRGLQSAKIESVQDLDSDGENDYVLYITLSGANCCEVVTILYFDSQAGEFKSSNSIWKKYTLVPLMEDIDHDGIPEFLTVNTDFNVLMGGAVALDAIAPIQIYKYLNHNFVDVTKSYPTQIENDTQFWLKYFSSEQTNLDTKIFVLSAYLADMYLLDQENDGAKVFEQLCLTKFNVETCLTYKQKAVDAIKKSGYDVKK